jgi:single-strand DNA-binding protein
MNHVNLIGRVSSDPKITRLADGRKVAHLTMSTKEMYLDAQGKTKTRSTWHKLTAWGRWVQVLEEMCKSGMNLAVEGKLISRFYQSNGERKIVSEVEINDLVIL